MGRRGLARFNPEVLAPHFDRVGFDADGRIHDQLAGGYVILPAMPGAGDSNALKLALAEGASAVQAGVIDGVELVSYVCDSDCQPVNLELADRAGWNLIFSRRTDKSHQRTPSVVNRKSPTLRSPETVFVARLLRGEGVGPI